MDGPVIRPPKFTLDEIEDYYTYYVLILKIPDHVFWERDLRFLDRIAEDKVAYDAWLRYAVKKEGERRHGK